MQQLQNNKEPRSIGDLQNSYNELYKGWMKNHKNIWQAQLMLDLMEVEENCLLLDIGCGTGYVLGMASERKINAFGIDISITGLRQAKRTEETISVSMATGEQLPFCSNQFDYAINLGSLEHFLNPLLAVSETNRILKPNGKAAILVPNSHHICAVYNVYRYGEIISDLQDYERYATRKEWEKLLENGGLRVISTHKVNTGLSKMYKSGREFFWYLYNTLFRLFGDKWIPKNLSYSFIFLCRAS